MATATDGVLSLGIKALAQDTALKISPLHGVSSPIVK
jgi:hypothetical protein